MTYIQLATAMPTALAAFVLTAYDTTSIQRMLMPYARSEQSIKVKLHFG